MGTPLENLEDAVQVYFEECGYSGDLSGWVLAWQSSKITASSNLLPLSFASSFTMSAATSPETAMGLAHLTAARLERLIVFTDDDEGDDV